ncbi:MAG TPA: prepilin-type N-terminal cleavage/methylation domain-containing protein [Trueperaceae bacterium]|nr:prepilin-type N-terminal cleavage/methylation domain-containing protein [Trueperaceae bacterium]
MRQSTAPGTRMFSDVGLTLLEVVIAVAILAVGALGAAALQATGLKATRAAQDVQRLNTVARSTIDVWRGADLTTTVLASFDCSTDDVTCVVEIRPCALAGAALACDLGTVTQPVAHAVSVLASSPERQVALDTVVMR